MSASSPNTKFVIDEARFVAGSRWTEEQDESTATIQAAEITRMWQQRVMKIHPDRYKKEVAVGGKLNVKIDLVDSYDNVGYELKVSGNNSGHEFYKDLFKAVIYNQHHNVTKLQRLVFITESKGIDSLEKGLAKAAADLLLQFNITVELARLD